MSRDPQVLSPFGQQLRHWRRRSGVSQLDLAVQAGTSPRHVSFIETGRSRPGRDLVLRLAAALDVPIRERNALLTSAGSLASAWGGWSGGAIDHPPQGSQASNLNSERRTGAAQGPLQSFLCEPPDLDARVPH